MLNRRIEKSIELKAPVSGSGRRSPTIVQFGEWFRVKLDGPLSPGKSHAAMSPILDTKPEVGSRRPVDRARILISFTWHPYAVEAHVDYSSETPTLVEFRLQKTPVGNAAAGCQSQALTRFPVIACWKRSAEMRAAGHSR